MAQQFTPTEINRWKQRAASVNIIRDQFGVPHVYGKTDADAVFGLLYAQCEDDFKRVEMNYVEKLGRMAELKGESALYGDLYTRLIIDSSEAIADFKQSPIWLKRLLMAYADGINFYLYSNPSVKPALLQRFQPWYPLLWTDGSIGAISTGNITVNDVKNLYGNPKEMAEVYDPKKFEEISTGSNGFAVGPSKTASGNAILYINPHVTFYFRPEVHMVSEEGLNAYGAVTWGQFFVYQGFNESCGWMHTSNNVDVSDMYIEKVSNEGAGLQYEYEGEQRKLKPKPISIRFKTDSGLVSKTFVTYTTHHGPVMGKRKGQYISIKSSNRMLNGITQSWLRTKATGLEDYKKTMELKGNTSNSTVFADNKGNIAYWHGNYIPIRDTAFNWSQPVDGSIGATEWKGLHPVNEIVHTINPTSGFIQNCNSTPYTVSGSASPLKYNYPAYMAPDGENFRGINAVKLLSNQNKFTMQKMIDAGYDRYMAAFEVLVPALIKAYESGNGLSDSMLIALKEPIALLKKWDYYSSNESVATTLAIEWVQLLNNNIRKVYVDIGEADQVTYTKYFAANAKPIDLVEPLLRAKTNLEKRYGKWDVAWGTINRFQRINNNLELSFDDQQESVAVPFASALWGMLPSYNSSIFSGTVNRYGISGNSFVCVVEFGAKVKAKSLLAGGNSGDPRSPHFKDQLEMYSKGIFKDVLFYKEDVMKNMKRTYHPGE
jgi:acyl-homoserine lactone acylase PvdQ